MPNKLILISWVDDSIFISASTVYNSLIVYITGSERDKYKGLKVIDLDSGIDTSTPIPPSGAIVSGPVSISTPPSGVRNNYFNIHNSPIGGPVPFRNLDSELLDQQQLNLQGVPSRNNIIPPPPMDPADGNFIDTPSNRRSNVIIKEWTKTIKGNHVGFSIQEGKVFLSSGRRQFMSALYEDNSFSEVLTLGIRKSGIFANIMKALDRFLSQRIIISRIKSQIKVENIKL